MQNLKNKPPSVDFGPPKPFGGLYPVYPRQDAPKSILVRFWRFWRRLIRKRQDSWEVRRLRGVIRDQDQKVAADLLAMRIALDAGVEREREMREITIPTLQNRLEVEKAYSEGLATLVEKMRTQVEADMAVNSYRIAVGKVSENEAKRLGRDD